jgi:two-component system sensor histidine kinase AlgZ
MNARMPGAEAFARQDAVFFLPSFCDVRLVFAVVVIAELIAFVLVLVSPGIVGDPWSDLGLISLFMQWIALSSAAVLCLARPLLARLGNSAAALVSYLLVLLVTAIVSELAFRLTVENSLFMAIDPGEHVVFLLRTLTISTVVSAVVLRYLYVQHQWRQQLQAETRARIQALQARIRPHFLFNSMNTIAALTHTQPDIAEEAINDLSDLFRASLNHSHERTTLGDELLLARRYLNIEALRLGERLEVEWELDGVPLEVKLPPLILQPLLENAIYHGVEPMADGGTIRISGGVHQGIVHIHISNPVPESVNAPARPGNQMAQENTRQRLELAFGTRGKLEISQQADEYRVTLRFPEERLA